MARRTRLALIGGLATLVVLGAVAVGLCALLAARLQDGIDARLAEDAAAVRAEAADGAGAAPATVGGSVQVVDRDGTVLGGSPELRERGPLLAEPHPWVTDPRERTVSVHDDALGRLRVRIVPDAGSSSFFLLARSAEEAHDAVRTTAVALAVAVPLLALVAGAASWVAVGWALGPVRAVRSSLEEITAQDLSRRITPPGTGSEVDDLARAIDALLDAVERATRRERELVADASHELRSPVAAVRALVESRPPDGSPGLVAHDRALAEALARLQSLVDQMLELARHDGAEAPPSRPVDLDDLVLQQAELLRHTTDLVVDTAEVSGGQVLGSEEALGRVVENLTSNAARHARGRVHLAVAEDGDAVVLEVSDDGGGIPPGERERVFERFTRLDEARDRDRAGAGLGLAIVARVVERHGGTVTADEGPGGGGRVTVRLPAAAPVPDGAA